MLLMLLFELSPNSSLTIFEIQDDDTVVAGVVVVVVVAAAAVFVGFDRRHIL